MIVVGGKDSANTKRLYAISKKAGARAYHIENKNGISKNWFKDVGSVGVVSGASTPKWIVDEVVGEIRRLSQIKTADDHRYLRSSVMNLR